MTRRLSSDTPSFAADLSLLLGSRHETQEDLRAVVAQILQTVCQEGDAALVDYSRRFDEVDLEEVGLEVTPEELDYALTIIPSRTRAAIEAAAERIRAFHGRQSFDDLRYTDAAGVSLGARYTPMGAVGVYVPGGRAAYPSTVLMNIIPARLAGVPMISMTVPSPEGVINPVVLAAARVAGADRVFRIGGAQAIAALTFGTETVPAVDKIVGPGNAYVAEAKRQVFGRVGIDSIAGPSEILVVADNANDPAWIAADLMSQAEHDPMARSVLITDDPDFATAVQDEVKRLLPMLPRREIAEAAWRDHGAIIVVTSLDEAPALVDRIAPEHLELAVANAEGLARQISNAGAVFLGRYSPEAIGDYMAGPNHVLPTDGAARFSSGLSVADFMKRTTLVRCDQESIREIGPDAVVLADEEGLTAHALSVQLRLDAPWPDDGAGP